MGLSPEGGGGTVIGAEGQGTDREVCESSGQVSVS